VNDLSVLPERLHETAEYVRRQWHEDPSRRPVDLLLSEEVPDADSALILDWICPGAGAKFLK
jgi:hypothetical protein